MQHFLVVYHGISQESLVYSRFTHESLGECVIEKTQVTSGILHGIPRESVVSAVENTQSMQRQTRSE